ncbi:MAG: MBL fold metallo-hydrolase [Verrucomicrobia bacterium]|nr:MBL fold metallo-hydrolase [Verrucomicrobiota bacterium]
MKNDPNLAVHRSLHSIRGFARSGRTSLALVASGAVLAPVLALAQLKIDSFSNNGVLSWSDPGGTGSHYAIQWSPSLSSTNWYNWSDSMTNFTGLGPTGSVTVPMYYRMVVPDPTYYSNATYSYYYQTLPLMKLPAPLASNEMRITFMGSMIPLPVRKAQAEMSVFVEVGWKPDTNDVVYQGRASDQFCFDYGCGVSANYAAASVGFRRMDKLFINHLHGDHMSDLIHLYCFGAADDRKSPLFIFGQSTSGVESPTNSGIYYNDGTSNFCAHVREACRWHSESMSFLPTGSTNIAFPTKASWGLPVDPVPVSNDSTNDGYAMVPIELKWDEIGVAYTNQTTGAKVTHYPVIHARQGSMGYKLEWTPPGATNPLTMIYSSDTKPETNSVFLACNGTNGVDVFIHEMVIPPDMWAWKNMELSGPPTTNDPAVYNAWVQYTDANTTVQNSSHTPQGAFGYLLSQISPPPKLTVATHFPVADDTVNSAFNSVKAHCPNIVLGKDIIWSFDLMVLRVFPDHIEQYRADASDYAWNPYPQNPPTTTTPKYHTPNGDGDPYAQINVSTAYSQTNQDGSVNWNANGY